MSVFHIDNNNFKKEVLESNVPVLVDFWAEWCGPCRMLAPIIEELGDELDDVKVCKVNVDESIELAQEYGISSIPTLLVFNNGKLVNNAVGVMPKAEIINMLNI